MLKHKVTNSIRLISVPLINVGTMNEVLEADFCSRLGAVFACNMILNVCSFGGKLMCLMKRSMPSME
jgi:hypothetical protein